MNSILDPYHFSFYTWVHVAAAGLGIIVLIMISRRWSQRCARALFLMELCVIEWTIASVFEVAATNLQLKLLWSQIAYAGTVSTPVFYFLFSMIYSQHENFITPARFALLFVIPVITLAMAWTNNLHHLLWTNITINPVNNIAVYGHGLWFYIHMGYSYIMVLAGFFSLFFSIVRFPDFYKSHVLMLSFGSALPIIANIAYIFDLLPIPGLELTPLSFMLSGLFVTLSMVRFRMCNLIPVAREKLFNLMGDGVVVIDSSGRVVDLNLAMEKIIGISAGQIIGQPADRVFSPWKEVQDVLKENKDGEFEITLNVGGESRCFDLHLSVEGSTGNIYSCKIVVFRDITKRRMMEIEREKLISELQKTLEQVKTLKGLIPICASCKKIRNDRGYWEEVENYINAHSDATFTHSICPDCMKKLYPEYVNGNDKLE